MAIKARETITIIKERDVNATWRFYRMFIGAVMKTISIDIETYSSCNLQKCGAYPDRHQGGQPEGKGKIIRFGTSFFEPFSEYMLKGVVSSVFAWETDSAGRDIQLN